MTGIDPPRRPRRRRPPVVSRRTVGPVHGPVRPSRQEIQNAADVLRAGGVVAFPTETVYGLGADARNADAVAKVFSLKRRPARNPLIVHVLDEAMARSVAGAWPDRASRLARAFWPGPLSIVVARAAVIPPIVAAGGDTIAVRCPDHPVAAALLEAFGAPLVGPSANVSGGVSPTTAEHVRSEFTPAEVLVLDGGPCRVGIESTVVDVTAVRARVLRPGGIGADAIGAALGEAVDPPPPFDQTLESDDQSPAPSPGMLASHYAPGTPTRMLGPEALKQALASGAGRPRALLALTLITPDATAPALRVLRMPLSAEAYASRLYAALREADALGGAEILVERPEGAGALWDAIRDRLRRACAPRA